MTVERRKRRDRERNTKKFIEAENMTTVHPMILTKRLVVGRKVIITRILRKKMVAEDEKRKKIIVILAVILKMERE